MCFRRVSERLKSEVYTMLIEQTRFPVPEICGDYINVYRPAPDVYEGEDTQSFRRGQRYDKWIVNDFDMVKTSDGFWHLIGITHPAPLDFIDHFHFNTETAHEAESQLFHAVSKHKTIRECLFTESFDDAKKLLYPKDRPGERPECWAPDITRVGGIYHMIYTPQEMRHAVSDDLYMWNPAQPFFTGSFMMRDPFVFFEDGTYTMIYVEDDLMFRTSTDFISWSDPAVFQNNPYGQPVAQESPCLYKRNGVYYLLWCIHDGTNSCYDDRTFVFAAETTAGLRNIAPLTIIKGHATVMFDGEDGQTYAASAYYPENGVNIAPICWV